MIIINDEYEYTCKLCKIGEFIGDENENETCNNCGYIRTVYTHDQSFNEQYYLNNYSDSGIYTKLKHFKKTLANFQGKQNKRLDATIMENIKAKYAQDPNLTINYANTRSILKEMKLSNLYDHVFLINKKLGFEPLKLTNNQEEYMIHQFNFIHGLYPKHTINKTKVSFFNYYYVFYKLCQMNGLDYILPFIPMLKTKSKIIEHEELFKSICSELEWEFVSLPQLSDSGDLEIDII
jgi:predicted DNA-binding protein YlxM (UPF0122 family)